MEARKTFAAVLDQAKQEGSVLIKRADGSLFRISPIQNDESPFSGIKLDIHLREGELLTALEDARRLNETRYP